jgi:hypothetical protein
MPKSALRAGFCRPCSGRPLVVSVVSVEELLEGAISETDALAALQRFTIQGLHLALSQHDANT